MYWMVVVMAVLNFGYCCTRIRMLSREKRQDVQAPILHVCGGSGNSIECIQIFSYLRYSIMKFSCQDIQLLSVVFKFMHLRE